MPLVGQIGKSNEASQFSANNVSHVLGGCGGCLWVFRGNGLRAWAVSSNGHDVAALDKRRGRFAIGDGGLRDRRCARGRLGRDAIGS